MARSHGKVSTGFWNNPAVRALPEDGRLLLLYLFTCPHSNAAGCFVAPMAYIARDMQWPSERVAKGFATLSQRPFVHYDQAAEVVYIPGWWDENQIENPNVALHVIRLIRDLPDCALKTNAINNMMRFPKHKEQVVGILLKEFPNPIETVSEPFPIPEPLPLPDPEPLPDPDKAIVASAPASGDGDDLDLPAHLARGEEAEAVKIYNRVAEQFGWGSCQKLTTARKSKIRARLRDCGGLEGWSVAMTKAGESKFLRGEGKRGRGHENWKPDLDFYLSEEKFTQLMEGKYDDRSSPQDSYDDLRRQVLEGTGLAPGMDGQRRPAA